MIIRKATIEDAARVLDITKRAFELYSNELPAHTQVAALLESIEDVRHDIADKHVIVAQSDTGQLVGTVRWQALSADLAYLYRFGVDPSQLSSGVGSDLLNSVLEDCASHGHCALALHTNARYFKLARYYYGKEFFVHSTSTQKGYIRALFVKELSSRPYDISPAQRL